MTVALHDVHYAVREAGFRRELAMGISVSFPPREVAAIMGPSGSGKTTLLCLAGGLLLPDRGMVSLDTQPLPAGETQRCEVRRRHFGFVFQDSRLLDQLTVFDNVFLPGCVMHGSVDTARRTAARLIGELGLSGLQQARASTLSGGERHRVAVARSLVGLPRVLLADEPTAALDWQNASRLLDLVRERSRSCGIATVVVTHDPRVLEFADRCYELRDGGLHPQ